MTSSSTILSTIYSIKSTLTANTPTDTPASTPRSHLLHPLGPTPPLDATYAKLTTALSSVHSTAIAFFTPPPADTKYLGLLKESAENESLLLQLGASQSRARDILRTREEGYGRMLPVLGEKLLRVPPLLEEEEEEPGRAERTLRILESAAEQAGLESFRDEPRVIISIEAGAEENSKREKQRKKQVVVLSIGGSVMVIDLEVESERGRVEKVKFVYSLGDRDQCENVEISKRLAALLDGLENVGEGPGEEEEKMEFRLREFREGLRELKRLDGITARTSEKGLELDCFRIMTDLTTKLRSSATSTR